MDTNDFYATFDTLNVVSTSRPTRESLLCCIFGGMVCVMLSCWFISNFINSFRKALVKGVRLKELVTSLHEVKTPTQRKMHRSCCVTYEYAGYTSLSDAHLVTVSRTLVREAVSLLRGSASNVYPMYLWSVHPLECLGRATCIGPPSVASSPSRGDRLTKIRESAVLRPFRHSVASTH